MSEVRIDSATSSFPSVIGYEIHAEQRRDRLGAVYSARQVLHAREISLRLVDERISGRDLTRACKSARQAGLAVHRQLLSPLEVGENDGQFYLVSQLPGGVSLRQRLAAGPLPPAEAACLVADIARAVYHLHEHRALHLGLTSSGIFLESDGSPRVGDIGLSELLHDHPGSAFPGDPAYAAPEQRAMKKADVRTDVYALGCLLQECLMGSPAKPVSGCPPTIEWICRKALASRPERRFSSAAELAGALERFQSGEAAPSGTIGGLGSFSRRYAVVLISVAVSLIILFLSITGIFSHKEKQLQADTAFWRQQADGAEQRGRALGEELTSAAKQNAGRIHLVEEKLSRASKERDLERKRAVEEERQRRAAENLAREHSEWRQQAEERVRDAEAARSAAVVARGEAARQLVRLHVATGTGLMEEGDLSGALLPFIRALSVARAEKLPEEAHRLRIAALLSRCPRPLCLLSYKKGDVQTVALSPDGQSFLVIGTDGVVVVRAASGGKLLGKRLVHGAAVAGAVFSPDGQRLLTADAMGRLRMWNIEEGTTVFEPVELEAIPLHLGFSGDGKRFVMVVPGAMNEEGSEAQVHDAIKGEMIGKSVSAQVAARPASLSPDGTRLLVSCTDHSARVYDVQTGKQIGSALEHPQEVVQASFSVDGRTILTVCADGMVRTWDGDSGKPIGRPLYHKHPSLSPKMDDNGRFLLTVSPEGVVRIHDTTTGKQLGQALRSRSGLVNTALSGDGRMVQLAGADGVLTTYDVRTGESVLSPLMHAAAPRYLALSPDSSRSMTFDGRTIRVWDLTAGEPLGPTGPIIEPDVVYANDGNRSARIRGNTVEIRDLPSGKLLGEPIKHKGEVQKVIFSRSGNLLLSVSHPPEANVGTPTWDVRVWQTTTGKPVSEVMEHIREVDQAKFADETRVLTISKDKQVRLWDARTGKQIGKPRDHPEDVLSAQLTPDGRRVVSSDKDGMTRIWDAETGDRMGEGMGHAMPVRSVAFSSDSKSVATCCEDGTAHVWDLTTGRQVCQVEHTDAVTHAAFRPDGKLLLTASADGTARSWVVATGKPHTPPLRHAQPVHRVAFSEEGRWLLTAAGPSIRLWDAETGEPIGPPLRHSWSTSEISELAFAKSGEWMTSGGPGTRWTRKLVGDSRAESDLNELARVLSGREEAGPGQLAPAAAGDLESAWDHVAARFPEEFTPSRARQLAWARRGAAEGESKELWAGAMRHLDVLLEENASAELLARRARARASMRQFAAALADYTKALASSSNHWEWWAGRGVAQAGLRRWDQAVSDLTRATELEGRRAESWQRLGQAEAERGQWTKAADALAKAIRFGADDPLMWYEACPGAALGGRQQGLSANLRPDGQEVCGSRRADHPPIPAGRMRTRTGCNRRFQASDSNR